MSFFSCHFAPNEEGRLNCKARCAWKPHTTLRQTGDSPEELRESGAEPCCSSLHSEGLTPPHGATHTIKNHIRGRERATEPCAVPEHCTQGYGQNQVTAKPN